MRRHLHTIALVLVMLTLLLNLILWGAVPNLPDVGLHIERSAHSEAILASTYIFLGGFLDAFVSSLEHFGASVMTTALGEAFPLIIQDPNLAMDTILSMTFNSTHRWIRILYWSPPILFIIYAVLWLFRPREVKLIKTR